MNRIIEANFLPPPVEETEEKPRILLIDDKPRFHELNKCFEFPNRLLSLRPESFKESSLPLLSFVTALLPCFGAKGNKGSDDNSIGN
jgi:hypothetical protein